METKKLLIGISGASGAPIAVELLRALAGTGIERQLIITAGGLKTLQHETELQLDDLRQLADVVYDVNNIGAGPASGSYKTMGMIIVPCSMKTLAGIYTGYSDNLLLRAADVTLKERRKLVLVPRESPFSDIHLRNLYEVSRMGAVILPPMLSYYNHPESVMDMTRHIVGKILDQFDLGDALLKRWQGL